MKGLKDKVAWVAGGGRGIGRAICEKLAAYGATVIVGSRTEGERDEVSTRIRAQGGTAHSVALDVGNRDAIKGFVSTAAARAGTPDVLVYCAGVNVRLPAIEFPEEAWERILRINLQGAYRFLQEAGGYMIRQGRAGSIVTITSMLSHVATPNQSAYVASKGGLLMYSRLLAVEWAAHNIRVNCVSPGYIKTPLNEEARRQPSFTDNILAKTPMMRFGEPAEVAEAVCFLASPEASFITGAELCVDGGFLAGHPAIVVRTT